MNPAPAQKRLQPNGKTLSLIAGTTVCQAKCPFCISKTTPFQGMGPKPEPINIERLEKACQYAGKFDIRNAMITSKGEPALYPEHIETYLKMAQKYPFDSVELQTNGLLFGTHPKKYDEILLDWKGLGLGLIAISVVHYEYDKNKQIYTPKQDYIDLPAVINKLHKIGYQVRLSCTLMNGYIDSVPQMLKMIDFAQKNWVEQLTLRRMEAVEKSENEQISAWTRPRIVTREIMTQLRAHLNEHSSKIADFFYGATLYAYGKNKQDVCLTTGLTEKKEGGNEVRQLIFFPSGKIITDWRYDTEAEDPLAKINGVKIE